MSFLDRIAPVRRSHVQDTHSSSTRLFPPCQAMTDGTVFRIGDYVLVPRFWIVIRAHRIGGIQQILAPRIIGSGPDQLVQYSPLQKSNGRSARRKDSGQNHPQGRGGVPQNVHHLCAYSQRVSTRYRK
ncbi:hypothetical protein CPSG_00917 [Coccidioides posadasii str. Silveira]|uniref:Uncharacterized protein n=1 Tax=Coccidioides posadasii (strain RMSCC 757 / Silveira) TaxID=443226 RepID=E9CTS8_COCPS|nr:hypothetical protein CPSG_00917 [Coccidioides posadasii str. Silveira]